MIADFQELSDKIEQLAELTQSLRRENAQLRLDYQDLERSLLEQFEADLRLTEEVQWLRGDSVQGPPLATPVTEGTPELARDASSSPEPLTPVTPLDQAGPSQAMNVLPKPLQ